MEFNLQKILKALLFSTSEPLTVRDIQRVMTRFHEEAAKRQQEFKELNPDSVPSADSSEESTDTPDVVEGEHVYSSDLIDQVPSLLTAAQIREALDQIDQELQQNNEVYRVQTTNNGFRIVITPEFSEWVRLLRNVPKPAKLRSSALETLAIIAYRQPVTRAVMEAIRGVSVDNALNKLIELELITVVGRADAPGRPIQYGTTGRFLEFCGIASISDLPASDVLSPSQLNDLISRATHASTPQDGDVGLSSPDDDAEGELMTGSEDDDEGLARDYSEVNDDDTSEDDDEESEEGDDDWDQIDTDDEDESVGDDEDDEEYDEEELEEAEEEEVES